MVQPRPREKPFARIRATALPLCLCGLLTGCTLDSLWGSDSPRPALHKDDQFKVDPLCRDLVVDTNSLAPVPVVVTLTGKRRGSNLGAESVPVAVTRGRGLDARTENSFEVVRPLALGSAHAAAPAPSSSAAAPTEDRPDAPPALDDEPAAGPELVAVFAADKARFDELQRGLHSVSEALYKAEAGKAQGGDAPPSNGAPKDDKVVDADFTEEK